MRIYSLEHRRNRKKRNRRLKFYIAFLFMMSLVIGLIYVVRISPLLKVQITVSGLSDNEKARFINEIKAEIFSKNPWSKWLGLDNYLSWPKEFSATRPEFLSLTIQKNLIKKQVNINIKKREKFGIWCQNNENCYWFDERDGILIEAVAKSQGQLLFTVSEETHEYFHSGKKLLSENQFGHFKKILNGLKELSLPIKKIELRRELQEIIVALMGETEIILSLKFDPAPSALPALKEILNQRIISELDYIDLTVPNKVFLKPN